MNFETFTEAYNKAAKYTEQVSRHVKAVKVDVVPVKGKVLRAVTVRVFLNEPTGYYTFADENDTIFEDDPIYKTVQDAVDDIIDYGKNIGEDIEQCNHVAISKFNVDKFPNVDNVVGSIKISYCEV